MFVRVSFHAYSEDNLYLHYTAYTNSAQKPIIKFISADQVFFSFPFCSRSTYPHSHRRAQENRETLTRTTHTNSRTDAKKRHTRCVHRRRRARTKKNRSIKYSIKLPIIVTTMNMNGEQSSGCITARPYCPRSNG